MTQALSFAADCGGTSWPDAVALVALILAMATCFIVYRLTGGH